MLVLDVCVAHLLWPSKKNGGGHFNINFTLTKMPLVEIFETCEYFINIALYQLMYHVLHRFYIPSIHSKHSSADDFEGHEFHRRGVHSAWDEKVDFFRLSILRINRKLLVRKHGWLGCLTRCKQIVRF